NQGEKEEWTTNFPLKTQFPLFLRNVLYQLGNVNDAAVEESVKPGQAKTLRSDSNLTQVEVSDPQGKTQPLTRSEHDLRADFSYPATDRIGLYKVKWGDGTQRSFAVNLLDENESNIEPRPSVRVGNSQVASSQERSQPLELWKWFALVALILL